jgi:hypothetical protein
MIYAGIDVGITNLAIVKCIVEEFQIVQVIEAHRIDLGKLKHVKVSKSDCKLHHTNDAYDRIQHFLQEYADFFNNVDQVRIERQPITGLVHIEQLLFGHFRSKAKLVSPNAMHKFFNIQHYDYEGRKKQTQNIAQPYLKQHVSYDWEHDRVHDMTDALCLVLYSLHVDKEEYDRSQQLSTFEQKLKLVSMVDDTKNLDSFFDQFKYNNTISSKEFMIPKHDL